jgi:hypothetical protein
MRALQVRHWRGRQDTVRLRDVSFNCEAEESEAAVVVNPQSAFSVSKTCIHCGCVPDSLERLLNLEGP